jgi:hypothetical protein
MTKSATSTTRTPSTPFSFNCPTAVGCQSKSEVFTLFLYGTNERYGQSDGHILTQFYDQVEGAKGRVNGITGPLGIAFGIGIRKIVNNALSQIEDQIKRGVTAINIVGNSRGAVNADRIAFAARKRFPSVKFKLIFGIDPVAGPNDKRDADARTVTDNVVKRESVLMRHERGAFYRAQDWGRVQAQDLSKTELDFSLMSGGHSAAIRMSGNGLDGPATIVHHKLFRSLNECGTKFKDNKMPPYAGCVQTTSVSSSPVKTAKQNLDEFNKQYWPKSDEPEDVTRRRAPLMLAVHSEMKRDERLYAANQVLRWNPYPRSFINSKEAYVRDSHYFFSAEHERLFKDIHPELYQYFFRGNVPVQSASTGLLTKAKVEEKLITLRAEDPVTFQALLLQRDLGIRLPAGKVMVIGGPCGRPRCESTVRTKLQILRDIIVQNMLRYQQDRPWWRDAFGWLPGVSRINPQHDRATAFYRCVDSILMDGNMPDLQKLEMLTKAINMEINICKALGIGEQDEYYKVVCVCNSAAIATLRVMQTAANSSSVLAVASANAPTPAGGLVVHSAPVPIIVRLPGGSANDGRSSPGSSVAANSPASVFSTATTVAGSPGGSSSGSPSSTDFVSPTAATEPPPRCASV